MQIGSVIAKGGIHTAQAVRTFSTQSRCAISDSSQQLVGLDLLAGRLPDTNTTLSNCTSKDPEPISQTDPNLTTIHPNEYIPSYLTPLKHVHRLMDPSLEISLRCLESALKKRPTSPPRPVTLPFKSVTHLRCALALDQQGESQVLTRGSNCGPQLM